MVAVTGCARGAILRRDSETSGARGGLADQVECRAGDLGADPVAREDGDPEVCRIGHGVTPEVLEN